MRVDSRHEPHPNIRDTYEIPTKYPRNRYEKNPDGYGNPACTSGRKIKCTGLSGTILATGSLSGCNDPANTGGSGTFPTTPTSSATITWASGGTTTGTVSYTEASKNTCASGDTEEAITGKVTSDTGAGDSVAVGGKIKGDVCVSAGGSLSLAPGTKFKI
jgi:hypothetical protein